MIIRASSRQSAMPLTMYRCLSTGTARIQLLLKTCPFFPRGQITWLQWHIASVINQVVTETGCQFLFDIAHARLTTMNLGWDWLTYIRQLPLQRLREFHITGIDPSPRMASWWIIWNWMTPTGKTFPGALIEFAPGIGASHPWYPLNMVGSGRYFNGGQKPGFYWNRFPVFLHWYTQTDMSIPPVFRQCTQKSCRFRYPEAAGQADSTTCPRCGHPTQIVPLPHIPPDPNPRQPTVQGHMWKRFWTISAARLMLAPCFAPQMVPVCATCTCAV